MCFRGGGVSGVWSKTILLHFFFGPFPKENKKIEINKNEFQNLPGQLDTLNEDMNSEMEVNWQCKVCGEELQNKIIMEKHVNVHFTEEYKTC